MIGHPQSIRLHHALRCQPHVACLADTKVPERTLVVTAGQMDTAYAAALTASLKLSRKNSTPATATATVRCINAAAILGRRRKRRRTTSRTDFQASSKQVAVLAPSRRFNRWNRLMGRQKSDLSLPYLTERTLTTILVRTVIQRRHCQLRALHWRWKGMLLGPAFQIRAWQATAKRVNLPGQDQAAWSSGRRRACDFYFTGFRRFAHQSSTISRYRCKPFRGE